MDAELAEDGLEVVVGGVVFEDANAELVLADPRLVSQVPAKVDTAAALALMRGGLIALSALRVGRVAPGESVLVTAAASGTGHLAVQLVKALGAARVGSSCAPGDPPPRPAPKRPARLLPGGRFVTPSGRR